MPSLIRLNFCCNIQMVGSEFIVENIILLILPSINSSGCWWDTLGLNATAGVVAAHVHPHSVHIYEWNFRIKAQCMMHSQVYDALSSGENECWELLKDIR